MPKRPGPRPHSAAVIELHGNASKLSSEELAARLEAEQSIPKARPLRLDVPADLTHYARECWKIHAPELERLGLLAALDSGAFVLLCETYAVAREALDSMRPSKSDGTPDARKTRLDVLDVDRVHGGQKKRAAGAATFLQAAAQYRAWAVEFGLTPSARLGLRPAARTPARDEGGAADDDDGAFFGT